MDIIDEYSHEHSGLIYVCESIPTQHTEEQFLEITVGCECSGKCTVEGKCRCLHFKRNYMFETDDEDLEAIQNNYELIRAETPMYECNKYCTCSKFCNNRLVQFGPRKYLQIIKCEEKSGDSNNGGIETKGYGLITTKFIKQGNFICEYAGEVLTQQEANDRYHLQELYKLMNYILCVTEHFGENCAKTFIDPYRFGNIGRYINHSCDPNCELIPIRVHNIIPKLCIFAKQDIEPDTELHFDYGDGDLGFSKTDKTVKKKKCLCGLDKCRKFLPFCKDT